MAAFASMIRGINVGGNRQVKMDELKALYESLELRDVVSYIQSGNVIFTSGESDPVQLRKHIEAGIEGKFGFHADVILRTSSELRNVVVRSPFQDQQARELQWVVVMFLTTHPDGTALEDLLRTYNGPEEIHLSGRDLYIYYPNGIGRSKLTNTLIEKKLRTTGTARNWNTILRLIEMIALAERPSTA